MRMSSWAGLVVMAMAALGCVTPNRPITPTGVSDGDVPGADAAVGGNDAASSSDGPRSPDLSTSGDGTVPVDAPGSLVDVATGSVDASSMASDLGAPEGPASSNPPNAPFVGVTPRSPTNNTKPTWTWMSGGNGGSGLFRYRLDANDLTKNVSMGIQSSFTPDQPLSEGSHTLYVQERSATGDWSASGSAEVVIDVTPPSAPVFLAQPRSPLNSVMPQWKWMSGGNGGTGTYRCKLDDPGL